MSFEILVGTWENEERRHMPERTIRERFARHIVGKDKFGEWLLAFTEGPGQSLLSATTYRSGFSVRNPPDYLEFWKVVAGFLRDFPCVLYWPGGGAVVGRLDMLAHLPKGMVETLGVPWVSADPERIRRYVWENS